MNEVLSKHLCKAIGACVFRWNGARGLPQGDPQGRSLSPDLMRPWSHGMFDFPILHTLMRMMGCHFQDRPCRPSLCLREHRRWVDEGREGPRPRYSYCAEETCDSCEHRAWDHSTYLEVAHSRAVLADRCVQCGGRHRLLIEMLRCEVTRQIDLAFEEGEGWSPEGCSHQLLGEHIPEGLRRSAWKTVRERVIARDGRRCQDCRKDLSAVPNWLTEVHHVVPKIQGGSDHPRNLKTLCAMCHRRYTDDMVMAAHATLAHRDEYHIAEDFQRGYWSEGRVITTRNPPK